MKSCFMLIVADQNDPYLTNHWPICNGKMSDLIGGSLYDMKQESNQFFFVTLTPSFTSDRFGNANSALALNFGYAQVTNGIFFDTTEFTISVWVYPQSVGRWARVMDFYEKDNYGIAYGNIILSLDSSMIFRNRIPVFQISNDKVTSSKELVEYRWQFLTATFNGALMSIYINGNLMGSQSVTVSTPLMNTSYNFIGESWNNLVDGVSKTYLDDLRFYKKSLSANEIKNLMNSPG